MQNDNKIWLLVDGHNLAFRCFYAVPPMTTADGLPVNAIHGWVRSLWKLEDILKPDAVCIFFDSGGSDARRDILTSYKANRKPTPSALKTQLQYLNLASVAMGYYIVSRIGIEADDLLHTFAQLVSVCGEAAYIASGDKDFAQSVGGKIFQLIPPNQNLKSSWQVLDGAGVYGRFGVYPDQMVDYLSLVGDSADNIPGVKGIGTKRALDLIKTFGSLENLFSQIDQLKSSNMVSNLLKAREQIAINKKLITLQTIPDVTVPETTINRQPDELFQFLESLQLHALSKMARNRYSCQGELF